MYRLSRKHATCRGYLHIDLYCVRYNNNIVVIILMLIIMMIIIYFISSANNINIIHDSKERLMLDKGREYKRECVRECV